MIPLLEQALHIAPETRRIWLKSLTSSQRESLQAQMTARQQELRIEPPTARAVAPGPKLNKSRYTSIRSGSFVNGRRVVRVGRHIVLLPSQALYKKTRDTLLYTYYLGVVGGYRANGAKLKKLALDADTRAYIARSLFNLKT
ncbi:hypothetical protein [Microbacterium aurugineum]|uniref:HK97 gp10 family phage protein n=1 Tax=Microbacterium aurugineum TaxID=2851642 RepID=A0ABY4IX33_9MICO|nr:hypothetical protein [Microbacterium aurugineum]UPL17249.1 hypothetical protein KV397_05500 [Microbacterium aurugineum]